MILDSFVVKVIAAFVVVATLITMSGVASFAPVPASAQQVISDGTLIRAEGSNDVYVVKIIGSQAYKRLLVSPQIFDFYGHLSFDRVVTVSAATLNSYATSRLIIEVHPDGTPVTGRVYQLTYNTDADTATKHWLNMTPSEFEAEGFQWSSLFRVNYAEAAFYPTGTPITPGDVDDGDDDETPGVEGNLSAQLLAVPSAVEVEAGENNVPVMAFELEADNSTIRIERADIRFDVTSGGDQRPWRYIDAVSLVVNGTVVGSRSISGSDDFNQVSSGVYEVRISGMSFNVPADSTRDVQVRVSGRDVIDSANTPGTIEISIPANGIRGVDGAGINQYAPSSSIGRTFTVVEEAAGDLDVSLSADSPREGIAIASTTSTTNDIEVLVFDVEVGDSDVTIEDVTVDFTTSAGDETDDVFNTAHLYVGNTRVASENVPTGDTDNMVSITFDNIDYDIDEDDTETFRVVVDVNRIGTADFPQGATIRASIGAGDITAEGASGDIVTSTGTAIGDDIHLYSVAPELQLVSTSIVTTPDTGGDEADATIVMDITARGGDVYIGQRGHADPIVVQGTGEAAGDVTYTYTSNAPTAPNQTYRINQGTTRRVTISAHITNDDAQGGFGSVEVTSVPWDTAAEANLDFGAVTFGLEEFETNSIFLSATN